MLSAIGTLTGQLVSLRAVAREDLDAMRSIRADPELRRLIMADGPAETADQQQRWLETMDQRHDQRVAVISPANSSEVCGVIGLYDIDEDATYATWGIYVNQQGARMTGASVEAALLLFDYAFANGISLLGARVLADNKHVRSLLRRFSFGEIQNQPADAVVLELSAAEYRAARPKIADVIAAVAARSQAETL